MRSALLGCIILASLAWAQVALIGIPYSVQSVPAVLNYSIATKTYVSFGNLLPGDSPNLSAFIPDMNAILYSSLTAQANITTLRLFSMTTGNVTLNITLNCVVFSLHYDFNLKQTFGLAVIDAENWALIKISLSPAGFTTLMSWPMSSYSTPVPASTTYCPIGHTFFIPLAEDSSYTGPFQLYRINVTSSSIIGNLTLDPLSDSLNNLFWDYSAAKLYAAISSNTSELLYGVDMTTGDFTPLLATAPNFDSYGLTAIDSPNHVIYSITEAPTNLSTGLWSFDLVKGAQTFVDMWDSYIDPRSVASLHV